MKYIRTKDGIYELIDFSKTNGMECANHYGYKDKQTGINMLMTLNETKRYKQADTIEELCDEFVVIYNESKKFKKPFTSFYSDTIGVLKEHDLSECEIYGAIWTDKGLIYVAKMNDKGELELL